MIDDRYVRSNPTLNLAGATRMLAAAHDHALRLNVHVAISLVDSSGELLTGLRMDRAPAVSAALSAAKARTAAQMKMMTSMLQSLVDGNRPSYLAARDLCLIGGGIPIWGRAGVIGAVGVSGADEAVDQEIAEEAARCIEQTCASASGQ